MFKSGSFYRYLTNRLARTFVAAKKDYYSVLGVPKDATKVQIKKAFAQKVREYHPDKNPSPEAKDIFSSITEAYETLSDENKRKVYDSYGLGANEQKRQTQEGGPDQGFGGFWNQGNMNTGGFDNIFNDFEDIFGFGMGRKAKKPSRGADVTINLELTFMEAIMGVSKDIAYKLQVVCDTCNGSKCKPGTSPIKCSACDGKGNINYRQGPMMIQMTCESCMGVGTTIKDPCNKCRGTGMSYKQHKESVRIPAGIDSGKSIRLGGKGGQGEVDGIPGDIIIQVVVIPDPYFKRVSYDIYGDIKLSIAQAVLGDTIEIRTVYGIRKVAIPSGTNHGNKIRIPNEGVKKLDSDQKGDHYCVCNVYVPKNLGPEEKKIFERLRDLDNKKGKGEHTTSSKN